MATQSKSEQAGGNSDGGPSTTIKKGSFYTITDEGDGYLVVHDSTKRGLEAREHTTDEDTGVMADKGVIYNMDGIGHTIPIRWYFEERDLQVAVAHAEAIEEKYKKLRELTCPDY